MQQDKHTILLVEDETLIAMDEARQLKKYGYEVVTATSGREAIDTVDTNGDIDLILMDIDLGLGMDGTQAAEIILRNRDLPVVFLSSHTEPAIVEKTEKITSYGYVVKNSGITVLDASIKMAFKLFNANRKIGESEEKYRLLHEQAGVAIGYYTPEGVVISYNERALANMKMRLEDVAGKSLYDLFPGADADKYMERIRAAIAAEGNMEYEDFLDLPIGKYWFSSVFAKVCSDQGKVIGIQIISRDITVQRQAEEKLRESEEKLDLIMNGVPVLITYIDREERYLYVNRAYAQWYGEEPEQMIGKKVREFLPPNAYERAMPFIRAAQEGKNDSYVNRVVDRQGRERYVAINYVTHASRGEIKGFFTSIVDITDQKYAETRMAETMESLRQSEERYRSLLSSVSDYIYTVRLEQGMPMAAVHGAACVSVTGYSPEEYAADPGLWYRMIHEEDRHRVAGLTEKLLTGSETVNLEHRIIHRDGTIRWVRNTMTPVLDRHGRIVSYDGLIEDVSERKKVEEALQEKTGFLQSLFNSSPMAIYCLDREARVTLWSPAAERMFGWNAGEVLGKPNPIVPPDKREEFASLLKPIVEEGKMILGLEVRRTRKDGSTVDISLSVSPLIDDRGGITGAVGMMLDIGDRKHVEKNLAILQNLLEETQAISKVGGWEYDVATGRVTWTSEVYDIYNVNEDYDPNDIKGDIAFYTPEHAATVEAGFRRAVEHGEPYDIEAELVRAGGERIWVRTLGRPQSEGGRVVRVLGNIMDITERKRAEYALRVSEERLRLANRATNDVIWDWDIVHDTQRWNEAGTIVFGWTEIVEGPVNAHWWVERVHPDDRARVDEGFFAVVNDPENDYWQDEYRFLRSDGTYAHVMDRGFVLRDARGRAVRMIGAMLDITGRKRVEDALRASEEKFRAIYENAPVLIDAFDEEGRCTMWNNACRELFGWTIEEINEHDDPLTLFYPDPEMRKQVLATVTTTPAGEFHEWHPRAKDGRELTCLWANFRLPDGSIMNVGYDITGRKAMEEQLKLSIHRFELLAMIAGELLGSMDPQSQVAALCRRVMEHLDCQVFFNFLADAEAGRLRLNAYAGISGEEAAKIEWLDYGVAVCGCAAKEGCLIVAERIPSTPDERTELVKSYGVRAYAAHPLFGEGGRVIGTLSFGTKNRDTFSDEDISLMRAVADHVSMAMIRKKAEEDLKRSVREKELLMTELKHRVKNNLAIIEAFLELELDDADDGKMTRVLTDTKSRVHTVLAVYEQLHRTGETGTINLGKYLADVADAVMGAFEDKAGSVHLDTVIDDITIDVKRAVPLGIILNELVTNSFKYAYPHGRGGDIRVTLGARDNEITFTVADDGPGLPAGFDITTTESKGLKMVALLARQIGGSFTIKEGKGTAVRVTFPAIRDYIGG